jgi:Uma2 family endonuclease
MSAQPHALLTEEEYLKIERAAEFRHEYYGGRMCAMSGGSMPHAVIIGNLTTALGLALRHKECSVAPNDLRARITPSRYYTYPDVVVVCGKAILADDQNDTLLNPTLLIEILSPSTESHDRGFKFDRYSQIDSLQEYAIVSQSEPRVEIFHRQGGQWLYLAFAGLESTAAFASVEPTVPLAEIYHRIDFPDEPGNPNPHAGSPPGRFAPPGSPPAAQPATPTIK